MKLDKVQISHFRNIDNLSLVANKRLNVFLGENGSGKSSILEALHYLGFARSFRTQKHKNVIQHKENGFTVFCSALNELGIDERFGISRNVDDSCIININGQKSKRVTDLITYLPVQIFTPQSSELLLGSPKLRRRYLDWLLFHVEPRTIIDFQVFNKCLKQLNALYKKDVRSHEIKYWQDILSEKGKVLDSLRSSLLSEHLIKHIRLNLTEFLPEFSFEISYYRGWEKGLSLMESIKKNKMKDQKYGFLSAGPHKADLRIKTLGVNAHEVLSRGQLRMAVAAMQLAQTQYLYETTGKPCIFLLDDIGAELDEEKRRMFVSKLSSSDTQLFVTAIDRKQLKFLENYNDKKVFHVEHGQVREEI